VNAENYIVIIYFIRAASHSGC